MRILPLLIRKGIRLTTKPCEMVSRLLFVSLWLLAGNGQAALKIHSCSVTVPPNLVFVTNLVSGLTTATSFNVSCNTIGHGTSDSFTVGLSAGYSGTTAQREMKNGTDTLTYNLYKDPQYTQVWGTAGSELMTISIGGDLLNQAYTIYGQIDPTAANLDAPSGNYSDATIVLTISY